MNPPDPRTLTSFAGLGVRAELVTYIETKAAKLRRHRTPRVGTIRANVRYETPHGNPPYFAVCAQAEARGLEYIAHATGAEPDLAINSAFAKLERSISGTAGARRRQRHERPGADLAIAAAASP
jgi:ribosome-associated translation inhibitor RaiA